MALLFEIETEAALLTWSRRRAKAPAVVPAGEAAPAFGLRVEGGEARVPAEGYLFEQTDYTLFLRSKTGRPVALRHRDPTLLRGLSRSDGGRVLHGTINFGTDVGESRFAVEVGGREAFRFSVEVFPSKLDYRTDYAALRADIREIADELVLAYLRPTEAPGWTAPPGTTGTAAWLLLLGHLAETLEQALAYVAERPRWGTRRAVAPTRADRIRRPDAAVRRALRQRGVASAEGELDMPARLPASAARYTLDTPAHRWLAAQIAMLRRRLAEIRDDEARLPASPRRRQTLAEIGTLQTRLARLSRLAMLQEAEGPAPPAPPSLRLTAPGYRAAYRACLALQQSLSLDGGPLRLGINELHRLYEFWCYLMLVRLAARLAGSTAPLRSLIAVERHGLHLRLRKGRAQSVVFPLEKRRRLTLTYNPRFGGAGYLVPQQPDILLTMEARGGARRYVLDAKYRLDASPGYRRRHGLAGPPTEALNTLHRYRDAIRGAPPVMQAVALYPWRDDENAFPTSRLARLLGEIGIGALPLLPGRTDYLEEWLRRVVEGEGVIDLVG